MPLENEAAAHYVGVWMRSPGPLNAAKLRRDALRARRSGPALGRLRFASSSSPRARRHVRIAAPRAVRAMHGRANRARTRRTGARAAARLARGRRAARALTAGRRAHTAPEGF